MAYEKSIKGSVGGKQTGWLCYEDFEQLESMGSFIGDLTKHNFISIESIWFIGNQEKSARWHYRVWYYK